MIPPCERDGPEGERVAGAEELLLSWIASDPTEADLEPAPPSKNPPWRLIHFLWPPKAPIPESDVKEERFPVAFVRAWRSQIASSGTGAELHEKFLVAVGWALWVALTLKTGSQCYSQAASNTRLQTDGRRTPQSSVTISASSASRTTT